MHFIRLPGACRGVLDIQQKFLKPYISVYLDADPRIPLLPGVI
jgi:hypothetical protein